MTIKTKLHHYRFESAMDPGYKQMLRTIDANSVGRGPRMCTTGQAKPGGKFDKAPGVEEVEIDTSHLFGNQSNTTDGRRVLDWFEESRRDGVKRGHWLEITPELAEARAATHVCGFCGASYGPFHTPVPSTMFCNRDRCIGSVYLKADELHLLRLKPVIGPHPTREPLTAEESAWLSPLYVAYQTTAAGRRAKQTLDRQREDVLATFAKRAEAATAERDGMLWLWDHGVSLDNVIYYDHLKEFAFGWRTPVSPEVKSKLLDLLSEFPFPYVVVAQGDKKK